MKYARKPAQHLTPGDDQPTLPCAADVAERRKVMYETGEEYVPSPFDVLMDKTAGIEFRIARRDALAMCNQCPIRTQCLFIDNAEEEWAQALTGAAKPKQRRAYNVTPESHAKRGAAVKRRAVERRKARADLLQQLIDQGAGIDQACAAISRSQATLREWCRDTGNVHLYRALTSKKDAAA